MTTLTEHASESKPFIYAVIRALLDTSLLALPFSRPLEADSLSTSRHPSGGRVLVTPLAEVGLRLLDAEARDVFVSYLRNRADSLDEPGPNACVLSHPEIPARVIIATYPDEGVVLVLSATTTKQ